MLRCGLTESLTFYSAFHSCYGDTPKALRGTAITEAKAALLGRSTRYFIAVANTNALKLDHKAIQRGDTRIYGDRGGEKSEKSD